MGAALQFRGERLEELSFLGRDATNNTQYSARRVGYRLAALHEIVDRQISVGGGGQHRANEPRRLREHVPAGPTIQPVRKLAVRGPAFFNTAGTCSRRRRGSFARCWRRAGRVRRQPVAET